jgi:hypothetical protein
MLRGSVDVSTVEAFPSRLKSRPIADETRTPSVLSPSHARSPSPSSDCGLVTTWLGKATAIAGSPGAYRSRSYRPRRSTTLKSHRKCAAPDSESAALVRREMDVLSSPPEHGLRGGRPPEDINLISRARSRDVIFDGMPESVERRMSAACPPRSQDYVAARLFVLVG